MDNADASTSLSIRIPRRRLSDDTRRKLLALCHRSDLTQRPFCEQAGIPPSTLQWWLVHARPAAARPTRAVAFAEIVAPACVESGPDRPPAWALEIVAARGLTVRLRSPMTFAVLARVPRGPRC